VLSAFVPADSMQLSQQTHYVCQQDYHAGTCLNMMHSPQPSPPYSY
jgi:hypothetical protein